MKKLVLTIAIVLGISLSSFAQLENGGGLFRYGAVSDEFFYGAAIRQEGDPLMPGLPQFNQTNDQTAPLGSGALLLIGFGAAYALKKHNKK